MSSAGTAATFAMTDIKLYVPFVTLKTENNAKLSKLLSEGFKRSIYRNEYNASLKDHAANSNIRERLDASIQGVNRLLVLLMRMVIMLLMEIDIEDIFFQGLKLKITTLKLMEEIFMTSQLMAPLSNTMKSEKYQQDKVMIMRLVVY